LCPAPSNCFFPRSTLLWAQNFVSTLRFPHLVSGPSRASTTPPQYRPYMAGWQAPSLFPFSFMFEPPIPLFFLAPFPWKYMNSSPLPSPSRPRLYFLPLPFPSYLNPDIMGNQSLRPRNSSYPFLSQNPFRPLKAFYIFPFRPLSPIFSPIFMFTPSRFGVDNVSCFPCRVFFFSTPHPYQNCRLCPCYLLLPFFFSLRCSSVFLRVILLWPRTLRGTPFSPHQL